MRTLLVLLLVIGGGWWSAFQRIRDANEAQQLAETAFRRRDFAKAAAAFAQARRLGVTSERLLLNLGHAHAQLGDATAAREAYGELVDSKSAVTRSVARQQLAVLAAQDDNYAQATSLLRLALLDNPANRIARYNYELLRAYQARRDSPQIPPPPPAPAKQPQGSGGTIADKQQPSQAKSQPAPGTGGGEAPGVAAGGSGTGTKRKTAQGSEPGSEQGLDPDAAAASESRTGTAAASQAAAPTDRRVVTRQRLQTLNLSEAQARQLLDALQTAEQQYLRQIPHRATRRPDPRKPAW